MNRDRLLPLWQKIQTELLEKIRSGELRPGQRISTEDQLMEQYGVSRITVVRAMKELAESGYIIRRQGSGSFINPNVMEVEAANGNASMKIIALTMPISSTSDFGVLNEIESFAQEKGYIISLYNTHKSLERERSVLELLPKLNFSGVISFPIESIENLMLYADIQKTGLPLVFIDRSLPGLDIPCIKTDNVLGAEIMTEHLINKGHTRISFFCVSRTIASENDRFNGYVRAMVKYHIPMQRDYLVELLPNNPYDSILFGDDDEPHRLVHLALEKLMGLPEPPTAVFCVNDDTAIKVQQQALAMGVRVPEDLSIAGFDNSELTRLAPVPLTTVAQDFTHIGRTALELIFAMIAHEPLPPIPDSPVRVIKRKSVKTLNRG